MAISGRSTQVCAYSFKGLLIVFFFPSLCTRTGTSIEPRGHGAERNGLFYKFSLCLVSFYSEPRSELRICFFLFVYIAF